MIEDDGNTYTDDDSSGATGQTAHDGASLAEVAAELGCAVETVRLLELRALRKLRYRLVAAGLSEDDFERG